MTVEIPLATLNQVDGEEFSWQVPGLREELVTELIRSLPKQLRRAFVPAPETARAVAAPAGAAAGGPAGRAGGGTGRLGGVRSRRSAWDLSRLPAHLRMGFRVIDDGPGARAGKDLAALREELRPRLACGARRGGRRHHPYRAPRLGHRHAAAGVHARAGPGLPGAG